MFFPIFFFKNYLEYLSGNSANESRFSPSFVVGEGPHFNILTSTAV